MKMSKFFVAKAKIFENCGVLVQTRGGGLIIADTGRGSIFVSSVSDILWTTPNQCEVWEQSRRVFDGPITL